MKKYIFAICLLAGFASCHHDDDDTPEDNRAKRTILVYMAAENNLSSFCTKDLDEMMAGSLALEEDQNLIVYVDKANSSTTPFLARVKGGEIVDTLLMKEGVAADPSILESVIRTTKDHYPAKSYGLVLWGHASGWIVSNSDTISQPLSRGDIRQKAYGGSTGDNTSSSSGKYWMNIVPMAQAINNALGSDKFKFILSDCCNLACIEVAYELRNATEYFIGSPAEIPDLGALYEITIPDLFNESDDFYVQVIKNYYDSYLEIFKTKGEVYYNRTPNDLAGYSVPLVAYKSSELDNFASATAQILRSVSDKLSPSGSLDLDSIMFYAISNGYNLSYDLNHVLKKNAPEADFKTWEAAYEKAVPYHTYTQKWMTNISRLMKEMEKFASTPSDCGSVSMFIPSTSYNSTNPDWNKAIQSFQWNSVIHWEQYGW